MTYRIYSFEKLEVYKKTRELRKEFNVLTKTYPKDELYGLISQIRRAACSLTANLAEGSGRATNIDKAKFTNISYSSCLELIDHLNASLDLDYINEKLHEEFRLKIDPMVSGLNALYKYQLNEEVSLKNKMENGIKAVK